jgi:vitamin K-dependent gamma-carboxylase
MSLNPYKKIDNSPLIVFRILFGCLLAVESFGSIFTGWVRNVFIEPQLHFQHIGFEWLTPLEGNGMLYYYAIMGVFGLMIMVGYRYRLSIIAFTLMWTAVYLMQKSAYNNHYYLLILVSFTMIFLPAHRYKSFDSKINPEIKSLSMPAWCSWIMILQMAIVYFYATLHKFYPDWLDGTFVSLIFQGKDHYPIIGKFLSEHWFHIFISYMGIAFDGLVVPLLLWKRSRNLALIAAFIFHIFNSITLHIGIFPYFALSFALFFYEPETIRRIFLKNKPQFTEIGNSDEGKNIWKYIFIPFLVIQTLIPLRHHLIEGDVLWTDEGHRLSWRMMLRSRSGYVAFNVVDKNTGEKHRYKLYKKIKGKQLRLVSANSDAMWQMAQHIKKEYAEKGKDVAVYVTALVTINGHTPKPYVDETVDLASVKWDYFKHSPWVILYDKDGNRVD